MMSQVWLVTGAGRGLGLAIAQAALEAGHHVVATARDTRTLDIAFRHVPADRLLGAKLDVTDLGEAHQVAQTDPVMRQPKRRLSWAGVPIDSRSVLLGLSAVGGFSAVDLGAVLYPGDWMAGERLTPQAFMDAFKRINGSHPGFRRNHAKAVAVAGYFDSTGVGQEFSKAAVFRRGRTPVVGRFSLTGGNPNVADTIDTPRGLALAFGYPGGEQWRTAMLNLPVFLDSSPRGFYDRLVASKFAPGTGKPDPETMARFLAAHPETVRAMAVIKDHPPTPGFGDSTFRSLNAFYFVSESGARTAVRWSLAPMDEQSPPIRPSGPNTLFDNLIRQIRSGPLQWKVFLALGAPTDPVHDATVAWPADRRVIDAGTVTLTCIQSCARRIRHSPSCWSPSSPRTYPQFCCTPSR